MKWLANMEKRDRVMLSVCLGMVLLLVLLLGIFAPAEDEIDYVPSSYSAGSFGAKAAYLLLERSGYRIQRWTQPLSQLAVDSHTTVILAEPYPYDLVNSQKAVRRVLQEGGRVLTTGMRGALLLPEDEARPDTTMLENDCHATPNGFDALARSGDVRIRPVTIWGQTNPRHRAEYLCNNKPVVVTYPYDKGQVIWWADALPLENKGISRRNNLELFLNSVGPAGTRVIWDESLHGEGQSLWSFVDGTPVHLVWWQLTLVAILLLASYARRSGPLRPDPVKARASSLEFVKSLGALYHRADATNTAVTIGYQQFRRSLEKSAGVRTELTSEQAAHAIASRLDCDPGELSRDLAAAENAAFDNRLSEKEALALVQAFKDHEDQLRQFAGGKAKGGSDIRSN